MNEKSPSSILRRSGHMTTHLRALRSPAPAILILMIVHILLEISNENAMRHPLPSRQSHECALVVLALLGELALSKTIVHPPKELVKRLPTLLATILHNHNLGERFRLVVLQMIIQVAHYHLPDPLAALHTMSPVQLRYLLRLGQELLHMKETTL